MVYVKCKCGTGVSVPEDFLATLGECPDCRRTFRVVAGAGSTSIAEDDPDGRLIIKSGPQRVGEQILLRGQAAIAIGKMPGKPIELPGNLVSRNHCRLIRTPAAWRLEDNKSTNGLFVNNKRIATADLKPGDCLRVGEYELEYALPQPEEFSALDDVEEIYDVAEEPAAPRPSVVAQPVNKYQPGPDSISCPSCGEYFPPKAKICVNCGIDIKTGKALLVSSEVDENVLFANTESVVRILSWLLPTGLYPVASEGYGNHKPYVIWAVTAVTILITILVWVGGGSTADGPGAEKSLMMWCGRAPTARDIERGEEMNEFTHWGDRIAFNKKFEEYKARNLPDDDARVKAYNDLTPDQQFYGTFSLYQLVTNGFLHGGIMHLAGNLVFLIVFGSRVNALVGLWRTAVLYFLLLIIASGAEYISMMNGRPTPVLGASGAIMGLAGMYFVLFPVHRVYMVIWARFLLTGFRIRMKIWALRGFWVVLFFIAFDVLATVLGSKDNVAHWAHLGGFIGGAVLGLVLLLTRQIDAMGGDILSATLGRRAWVLLGKPGERQQKLEAVAA